MFINTWLLPCRDMRLLLMISKDNPSLAEAEAGALLGNIEEYDGLLLADAGKVDIRLIDRLAYTNYAIEVLFSCSHSSLEKRINGFGWGRVYRKSYSVRKISAGKTLDMSERQLASLIWPKLKEPKVDLKDAWTRIVFVSASERVFAGILVWENTKAYLKRKPHLRPGLHPTSLDPKLARACVNLLGIRKGTVADPFCGTGGILVEAGLMAFRAVGFDISDDMIGRAEKNMQHFRIRDHLLKKKDALDLDKRYRHIVTDLPYGLNTKNISINELYTSFLRRLKENSVSRAVLIFPGFADHHRMIRDAGLLIMEEFSYYVHKSLTKNIVVLKTP